MTQQSVVLELPDEIYERARRVAEESQRPLESVLLDSLTLLFGNFPAELTPESMEQLSDDNLWAVVYRPLAWPLDARLRELTVRGQSLSDEEQGEIRQLVDQLDRYVLLRSKALLLLKQRGHDVERRLKPGA
jgi:hypothetical protein